MEKKFFNRRIFFVLIFLNAAFSASQAQVFDASHVYQKQSNIASVLFPASDLKQSVPVVILGQGQTIELSFDELEPAYTRTLYYSFVHCDAQWQPSDLMELDYIDGFNKVYDAERAENSLGTTADYVHYTLFVSTAPLTASGNYIIKVYDDEDPTVPLLCRPLMVAEQTMGLAINVDKHSANDDQQVELMVMMGSTTVVDSSQELKVAVWQNTRVYDLRLCSQPSIIRPGEAVYTDNLFSFEGGNEYRWLDNRDLRNLRANTQSIDFFDPFYHFTLYTDVAPEGYYYHEDFNGGRHIEAYSTPNNPAIAADYTLVHFSTIAPYGSEVYLCGALTDHCPSEANRLYYNDATGLYERTLRIKQGLHNYQYISRTKASAPLSTAPTESSFADTENDYTIAVYFRPLSGLYDRLVAVKVHNTMKSINAFVH